MTRPPLPRGLVVLERGWLSSNNVLGLDGGEAVMVDSGYVSHTAQTVALVREALAGRRLVRLINTHAHSDHVGGNAAVQAAFGCRITLPSGIVDMVEGWDRDQLLLSIADQRCDRFRADDALAPGDEFVLAGLTWRVYAAPGHDMNSLVFHNPERRILISADALWQDGFGVQFPELFARGDGLAATRATLETIGRLPIDVVIPGHGAPFTDVEAALQRAFARLAAFEADDGRMARNALRACLTFNLLEVRRTPVATLPEYLGRVALYREINRRFLGLTDQALADLLSADLQRAGVARLEDGMLVIAG